MILDDLYSTICTLLEKTTITEEGWISIVPWDGDSFKINNRAYYIDSEQAEKIRALIKYPEDI